MPLICALGSFDVGFMASSCAFLKRSQKSECIIDDSSWELCKKKSIRKWTKTVIVEARLVPGDELRLRLNSSAYANLANADAQLSVTQKILSLSFFGSFKILGGGLECCGPRVKDHGQRRGCLGTPGPTAGAG